MMCRNFWIAASISFFVSMIFSLCSFAFGGIFTVLMLVAVLSGWALWFIGLVSYFRMR